MENNSTIIIPTEFNLNLTPMEAAILGEIILWGLKTLENASTEIQEFHHALLLQMANAVGPDVLIGDDSIHEFTFSPDQFYLIVDTMLFLVKSGQVIEEMTSLFEKIDAVIKSVMPFDVG